MKIIRLIRFAWAIFRFYRGNKKLSKWMRKNRKYQDPNYFSYEERWLYTYKKVKKLFKATGIKLVVIGEDNIPKNSALITPNHVSNADIFALMYAFGEEKQFGAIGKKTLLDKKYTKGYFEALEGIPLDPKNPRDAILAFDKAGKWCKEKKRGMIIFPEGTRNNNESGELNNFKPGAFVLAKKFFLPIVPVTIIGTNEAIKWRGKKNIEIKIIFHKPIKQLQVKTLSTIKIAENVKSTIQKDLDKYSDGKVT